VGMQKFEAPTHLLHNAPNKLLTETLTSVYFLLEALVEVARFGKLKHQTE
jgi:hypothetical protein